MNSNTEAIVRLAWARMLGFGDDALGGSDSVLTAFDPDRVSVVALFDRLLVSGPDWLLGRLDGPGAGPTARSWVDQAVLLRACEGHTPRLVGQADLSVADDYVRAPGLTSVPVSDEPHVVDALERACPPDDVAEVGLSSMSRAFVTLDETDRPTAGSGYDEWQGLLAHLGVLAVPEHRRSGHGRRAAAIALNDALDAGLVPQWRCRVGNAGSAAVARRLGFVPVGSQTTVSVGA